MPRYSSILALGCVALLVAVPPAFAQEAAEEEMASVADPAELAFEEGRWQDAIDEYREILAASPADRLSLLRIAQAQRELKRYDEALATLESARTVNAPEAMIDFERARNLALQGKDDDALAALDASDHNGLRALALVESAHEFNAYRDSSRFQRVYRNIRARVYPCLGLEHYDEFDFWVGKWEVRAPDGTLIGHDTIEKRDGGCSIHESWQGSGGSSGSSTLFYLPSRGEWRQVWTGSGGTFFDMTGRIVDGQMRLEGQIEYAGTNQVVAFRGRYSQAPDGRVRQRLEEFDLAAQAWIVWFDGFFRRLE